MRFDLEPNSVGLEGTTLRFTALGNGEGKDLAADLKQRAVEFATPELRNLAWKQLQDTPAYRGLADLRREMTTARQELAGANGSPAEQQLAWLAKGRLANLELRLPAAERDATEALDGMRFRVAQELPAIAQRHQRAWSGCGRR